MDIQSPSGNTSNLNVSIPLMCLQDTTEPLPDIKDKSYPSINDITVEVKGVLKLLQNVNVNKATGPDGIPNKLLKACAEEVAPALTNIFQLSLDTGKLPED